MPDPVIHPSWSPYASMYDDPIDQIDPDGDFPILAAGIGLFVGAVAEAVKQVTKSYVTATGHSLLKTIFSRELSIDKEAFRKAIKTVDLGDVFINAVAGAFSAAFPASSILINQLSILSTSEVDFRTHDEETGKKIERMSGEVYLKFGGGEGKHIKGGIDVLKDLLKQEIGFFIDMKIKIGDKITDKLKEKLKIPAGMTKDPDGWNSLNNSYKTFGDFLASPVGGASDAVIDAIYPYIPYLFIAADPGSETSDKFDGENTAGEGGVDDIPEIESGEKHPDESGPPPPDKGEEPPPDEPELGDFPGSGEGGSGLPDTGGQI